VPRNARGNMTIDWQRGQILVRQGKGDKDRVYTYIRMSRGKNGAIHIFL
jgi:hypothetical protein